MKAIKAEKIRKEIFKKVKDFYVAQGINKKFISGQTFIPYAEYLILPEATKKFDPSWFGFPILVKESAPFTKNDIVNYLEQNKIATRMLFGGNLTKQPAYKNVKYRISGDLRNTDLVMNNLFWIGVSGAYEANAILYRR